MALVHAKAGDVVDLQPLGPERAQAGTAALTKTDRFEAVRLVVPAGKSIPEHAVPGQITLFCLEGRVLLRTSREIALRAGQWVYLERGEPHSVEAIEDCALLLTIMFDH